MSVSRLPDRSHAQNYIIITTRHGPAAANRGWLTRPDGHGECWSPAERFPSLAFRHPVPTTEGNKCNKEAVLGEIRTEHDGKSVTPPAMADEPSIEWWRQSNTGQRIGRDVGDKLVDLIKASSGSVEVPTGDLDDVINQRGEVLVN